jgi:hypothetical protein
VINYTVEIYFLSSVVFISKAYIFIFPLSFSKAFWCSLCQPRGYAMRTRVNIFFVYRSCSDETSNFCMPPKELINIKIIEILFFHFITLLAAATYAHTLTHSHTYALTHSHTLTQNKIKQNKQTNNKIYNLQ